MIKKRTCPDEFIEINTQPTISVSFSQAAFDNQNLAIDDISRRSFMLAMAALTLSACGSGGGSSGAANPVTTAHGRDFRRNPAVF
jgi:hypothetical protein